MASQEMIVLHLVGGLGSQGGLMNFVRQISSRPQPELPNLIWKHRNFQPEANASGYICKGRGAQLDQNIPQDIRAALQDCLPLYRWLQSKRGVILYAHGRMGIFLGTIMQLLTGRPLLIHLHALAGRPWIYRFCRRISHARFIFNSRKTCLHFGCKPEEEWIVMPAIEWPRSGPRVGQRTRFVACGALVQLKNVHLIINSFREVRKILDATLVVFGLSPDPLEPAYQYRIIEMSKADPSIEIRDWNPHWTEELTSADVFVHASESESFGIVILEAFAAGCRLVVARDTFLDDFEPPKNKAGIYRADLTKEKLAEAMLAASSMKLEADYLWKTRSGLSDLFSLEKQCDALAEIYRSVKR